MQPGRAVSILGVVRDRDRNNGSDRRLILPCEQQLGHVVMLADTGCAVRFIAVPSELNACHACCTTQPQHSPIWTRWLCVHRCGCRSYHSMQCCMQGQVPRAESFSTPGKLSGSRWYLHPQQLQQLNATCNLVVLHELCCTLAEWLHSDRTTVACCSAEPQESAGSGACMQACSECSSCSKPAAH